MGESGTKQDSSVFNNQEIEGMPFKALNILSLERFYGNMYTHPDIPGKIIKPSRTMLFLPEIETVKKRLDRFNDDRKVFRDLIKYGIHVTDTENLVAKFKGSTTLFCISDLIRGESLDSKIEFDDHASLQIDGLYDGILKQTMHAYESDGKAWYDFKNSQVVYGCGPKDKESFAYVVDVEPIVFDFKGKNKRSMDMGFWECIKDLSLEAYNLVDRNNFKPTEFRLFRNSIQALFNLQQPDNDSMAYRIYHEAKGYLTKIGKVE